MENIGNDYIDDREDISSDLTQTGFELKAEQILMDLQNLESNIDAKTEIPYPLGLSAIEMLGKQFEKLKFEISENFIKTFTETYKRLMVSKDRQARKEIIDAIIGMFERRTTKMSFTDKFFSNLNEL